MVFFLRVRQRILFAVFVTILLGTSGPALAETNIPLNVDVFPGSELRGETAVEFERYRLILSAPVRNGDSFVSEKMQELKGKVYRRNFFIDPARHPISALEVFTNYRDTFADKGFEILYECQRTSCGQSAGGWSVPLDNLLATNINPEHQYYLAGYLPQANTYAVLFIKGYDGGGMEYMLDLIEPRTVKTGQVGLSVDELSNALTRTGKVSIYDLYFDTGSAVLKDDSTRVLAAIRQVMSTSKKLDLYVVGHTDDRGSLRNNQRLSQARAAAVVDALISLGIAPRRLTPFGAGPFAPVTSNRTDSGRARNRRVELVEQLKHKK